MSRSPASSNSAPSWPAAVPGSRDSSSTSGSSRRAAVQNTLSGPCPPAWSQTQAATVPPGRSTRASSRRPVTGSGMKCTTSCAAATSKVPPGNGSASAAACSTSTPGLRSRHAATNDSDGSTAVTEAAPRRRTSSAVRAPGPQPTSSARSPLGDSCQVGESGRERHRVAAHEPVVRLGADGEAHDPSLRPPLPAEKPGPGWRPGSAAGDAPAGAGPGYSSSSESCSSKMRA